jgi:preprotein translocase subunit SecF
MKNGVVLPLVAVIIISSALLAGNVYTFGSHGHHRGMSAMGPCIGVMSSSQKANLKQTLSSGRQTLKNDHQTVASAKQALVSAILSGNTNVSSQESALATAQQQMQKDEDSAAQQVCGQLSST